jgi:CheY-like chemotaxis protein
LEKESGLKCGKDFTVGYSPERINPGDKEHTIDKIVKVVAGQDAATTDWLAMVYGKVVTAGIHKAPNIKVAEMAKAIENTQRDINIALINEIAQLYNMAFQAQQCDTSVHKDGLDAITFLADNEADLILLDLMMPEMDGFSFLEALQNNTSSNSKVIIASNLSDDQSIARARQYNCVLDYFKKSDYTPQKIVEEALTVYRKSQL